MKNQRILSLLLVMILVLASVVGCSTGKQPAETTAPAPATAPEKPSQVIIALDPDWKTFDPGRAYEMYANMIINAIYSKLVKFDGRDPLPKNDVAESYTVSDDKKTITFKLKSGVKFASGNLLTSKDVKWSYDRVKNLKGNPSFLSENIDKIDAPDDTTVIFTLKEPDGAFFSKIATSSFAILDSEVVKANGGTADQNASEADKAQSFLDNASVGSGPYILEKFVPDSEVVIVRNENYWKEKPAIQKIVLKTMKDANTQLLMLQKGDIDIAFNLNAEHMKQIKNNPDIKILQDETLTMIFLLMNADPKIGGPMANRDVQNAVRYALDYKGLQEVAGSGAITPYSIIQYGFLGALPPRDPNFTNIEKSKELLAKAGYPNGFKIVFDVATFANEGVQWVTLGEKIKDDLSKVGIDAEIRTSDLMVGLDEYRKGKQAFSIWGWGPDYPDPNNQLAFTPGDKVGLRANWKAGANPELEALVKQAKSETDQDKRAKLLEEIQKITAEDSPFAVFLQFGKQHAVRKDINGADHMNVYQMELDKIKRN